MIRLAYVSCFAAIAGLVSCTPVTNNEPKMGVTVEEHAQWFPIDSAAVHALEKSTPDGNITCESCHASPSVSDVTCIGCHKHPTAPVNGREVNATLHLDAPDFRTRVPEGADIVTQSKGCYGCHFAGKRLLAKFPHGGINPGANSFCIMCHAEGNAFAALPKQDFTHPNVGNADCGSCHVTATWKGASTAPQNVSDPSRNLTVDALIPSYTATTMTSVTPNQETIVMTMNHAARGLDAGLVQVCSNCHAQADQGGYYPGVMHFSLTTLGVTQPTTCVDCHANAAPEGFVGALDTRRSPVAGPMKHDAVAWAANAPTTTKLVTQDCVVCHRAPDELVDATWHFDNGRDVDAGTAMFHTSLTRAGQPQPGSCLDCHANTRPTGMVNAGTFSFDHTTAMGECKDCHASTSTWAGAHFHSATGPVPTTCLPCHEGSRPTATTNWMGMFRTSPFDYVTNSIGDTHGAGQDCAVCHRTSGTGVWGVNANWQNGSFDHATTSTANTTCITCHTTQRPDLLSPPVNPGFDHALNGAADCVGCHQATMTRRSFVNLMPIPGGDWRGGQSYPGGTLITAPNQFVRLPSTTLTRSGTRVTGMTTATVTLPNAFTHTSPNIPAQVHPGDGGTSVSCWHCHTSTGTNVTAFANGKFHAALTNYKATPTSGVTPLPQPTQCLDCHRSMRPPNIVSKTDGGTWLRPMDHSAAFTGGAVPNVTAMDCGSCHHTPGAGAVQWSDGLFHANVPAGATPTDCVVCHYPLTTLPAADVTQPPTGTPTTFVMKHRSTLVTTQACGTCHAMALSKAAMTPPTAPLWKTGNFHASLTATTQPTTCVECHAASGPTSSTQSTVTYTMPQGQTATNGGQWINHAAPTLAGKDCALCHQSDAKPVGSAWSHSAPTHSKVPNMTVCNGCHGTTNGKGTVIGTNNNLPVGLTTTRTTTRSSASPGVKDQFTHADINVTAFDCARCHTQQGPSTVAGIQGKEWAQANFHSTFTTASPLVINGTTGRCSNCHLNLKPGPTYAGQDHSSFTATGTDCSSCHAFPGTSPTAPNWLGATGGMPHPATGSSVTSTLDCSTCHGPSGSSTKKLTTPIASHYAGISNGNRCTSCHINYAGFKGTTANLLYGHTNASANSGGCVTCHAFTASQYTLLTTTPSLTRPISAGSKSFSQTLNVTGTFDGDSFTGNHTNTKLTRCGACHQYATTTAATNVWTFKHRPNNAGISNSKSTSGCNMCH